MALKRLATAEMITVSEPWLTKNTPHRKALAARPELGPVLEKVEQAHTGILQTQPPQPSGKLAALTLRAAEADARFDQLTRAIDGVMNGFMLAAEQPEQAQELASLHDKLLPLGLTIIQRSYREEAGSVRLVEERLTDADKAKLKKLALPGARSVQSLVDEWIQAGRELGKIEDARAAEQGVPEGMGGADVVRARNKWIRAVNALQSMAELHEVDADTMQLVFGGLWSAERAASRRGSRKTPTGENPGPTTPSAAAPGTPPAG